jgi:uncharacterized membrane protein
MDGLILILLFSLGVFLIEALWPLLVAAVVLAGAWMLIVVPWLDRRAAEARERLRHERARAEIDRIALRTQREMYEAARRYGRVIDATAVEVSDD